VIVPLSRLNYSTTVEDGLKLTLHDAQYLCALPGQLLRWFRSTAMLISKALAYY
jgi:hypothetical protein